MAATEDQVMPNQETGDFNEYPVKADEIMFKAAAAGEDAATGYARALVAGDAFLGHIHAKRDATGLADGDLRVKCHGPNRYRQPVTISGVAITNLSEAVYMSDDNTYTLVVGANSRVGRVVRFIGTDTALVEFQPLGA